jgi:hypothetical protein
MREPLPPRFAPPSRPDDPDNVPDLGAVRARLSALPAGPPAREQPDPGDVIADIFRTDGTTLRVAVKVFASSEGPRPYVDVRVWQNGWPVKGKGLTVRPRELADLAVALVDAGDHLRARRGP